jgi:hypothetical protein
MWPQLASNLWYTCLSLLNDGITSVCHHVHHGCVPIKLYLQKMNAGQMVSAYKGNELCAMMSGLMLNIATLVSNGFL